LEELCTWDCRDLDEHLAPLGSHSVFLRAEGAPAFVRALERHHAQLSGKDNFNAITALHIWAKSNEDVLSSIVETDVCSVVVQCIRTYQLHGVRDRLRYRVQIFRLFRCWLLLMHGSTALRKELIKSGAINIILQWLEDWGVNVSAETFLWNREVKTFAITFLNDFITHNFACKTMLVEIGGIRAIAAVIKENWGDEVIRLACKELLINLYCRCRDCTESRFCNLCGSKAKFACPCNMARYCSKECQRKDWKSHKTICGTQPITGREAGDNTFDEHQVLKETGTINPDDVSRSGIDVVERLKSALSGNDVMRWLLVLARIPYKEMLRSDGFAAVEHVMIKYEDVVEIQRRGCAFFVFFNEQEGVSPIDVVGAVAEAGGQPAILKAMKKYPYDTKLQGSACNAMIGLGSFHYPDGRCDVGAAHAVIGAMLRHKDDVSVQEGGCGFLCNMVSGHPENKKELVMAGVASVVAAASQRFWGGTKFLDDLISMFFTTLFKVGNAQVDCCDHSGEASNCSH
jgi:hypothetical protein